MGGEKYLDSISFWEDESTNISLEDQEASRGEQETGQVYPWSQVDMGKEEKDDEEVRSPTKETRKIARRIWTKT